MAIYHLSMRNVTRTSGKSFISYVAYINGERMRDPENGKTYNRTSKDEVKEHGVMLCKSAPVEWKNKEKLWEEVLKKETRSNSRIAKDFNVALFREFDHDENLECLKELAAKLTEYGVCVNWSFHDKDDNPHGHLLTTCRPIDENGNWGARQRAAYKLDQDGNRIPVIDKTTGEQKKGKKGDLQWKRVTEPVGAFDQKDFIEQLRSDWEEIARRHGVEIDHRSYKRQGLDKTPTVHVGKGKYIENSDRVEYNNTVVALNAESERLQHELATIEQQRQEQERKTALEQMKKAVQEYSDQTGISLTEMKQHGFDFGRLDPRSLIGIYQSHKDVINKYFGTLPPDQQSKTDAQKALVVYKKAVSELIREQPQEQQTELTAPPPKPKHTHVNHRKHTPPPLINGRKLSHEIDYQIQQEKNAALRDYEQAQRAADQERWRMQHRDDWDMD